MLFKLQTTQSNLYRKNLLPTYTQNTTPQRTELIKSFQSVTFLCDKELWQFCPKAKQSKFNCKSTTHIVKTFNIYCSRHETLLQTHTQFCNKHNTNTSLKWADRYSKSTIQLKFRNSVEVARVVVETLNSSVSTEYCEFPLPKLGSCHV